MLRTVLAASLLVAAASVAQAQPTFLLSVDSLGDPANDASHSPGVSGDGRWVAFASDANDLVAGDTNSRRDVFVHDRQTGATTRVSVDDAGTAADRDCDNPAISRDGRWVTFDSTATNLVAGDTNAVRDVFLHDRDADENGVYDEPGGIQTVRVSVDSAGLERIRASSTPSVSADGQWVAFEGNKSSGQSDLLVWDAVASVTRVLSVSSAGVEGNGDSENPHLSASGRWLVFESSSNNLVAGDGNVEIDVFLVDRDADEDGVFDEPGGILTRRVSVDSVGAEGNGASRFAAVSDEGRWVTFASVATNLVAGDANGKRDVFLHDADTGATVLVSLADGGVQGDAESTTPGISADGRMVVFQSAASNLVAGDTNSRRDVFVYDRDTEADGTFDEPGATALFRVSLDSAGAEANDDSGDILRPVISANGLFAAFSSAATNLVPADANAKRDVFGRFTSECGNLILTVDEECDDGNATSGDGCDANCTFTVCGNGVPTAGEDCDDANAIDGDGCDSNCTFTGCGNGIPTAGEECDDANAVEGDGCDSNCTFTACGNGIPTTGEECDEGDENAPDGCCSPSCSLIDFDTDGLCDVIDLADLPASLTKLTIKDTKGDPERPTGSVVWKGDLFVDGEPPWFSAAALFAQAEATGFRVEIHATESPPLVGDAPVYALDFEPGDCTFGGAEGERKKARCKKILPPPQFSVWKLTLAARSSSVTMKGTAKRADALAPLTGPVRVVLGQGSQPPLEFEASLSDCTLKPGSANALKCSQ